MEGGFSTRWLITEIMLIAVEELEEADSPLGGGTLGCSAARVGWSSGSVSAMLSRVPEGRNARRYFRIQAKHDAVDETELELVQRRRLSSLVTADTCSHTEARNRAGSLRHQDRQRNETPCMTIMNLLLWMFRVYRS